MFYRQTKYEGEPDIGNIAYKFIFTIFLLVFALTFCFFVFLCVLDWPEWAPHFLIFCFLFFFLFNVWWSTKGVRYTECQLSIFFLSALILLAVNKIDQKKQFIELLCLFCFLGWSLSICILGTHSHLVLEHVNIEHSLGARETWSGLFAFICLFFRLSRHEEPSTVWLKPAFCEWNTPDSVP